MLIFQLLRQKSQCIGNHPLIILREDIFFKSTKNKVAEYPTMNENEKVDV